MGRVEERIFEIERKYSFLVTNIIILDTQGDYFKLLLSLRDGSNLRVTEDWSGKTLVNYSYYWLDAKNKLRIGWDNAPHHKKIKTFPHHKHTEARVAIEESKEEDLERVLSFIEEKLS